MHYLTGNQAAALLGISRKTLYRWMAEGRLSSAEWTIAQIEARKHELVKRKRGPRRNPQSARYVTGRHRYEKGLTP
jgi:predicted site-specific integrase-resolvase